MRIVPLLPVMAFVLVSCGDDIPSDIDLREEMRDFVIGISEYAKASNASFVVIPQNGIELVSVNGESDGPVHADYLEAIDGHGQEDLYYGYKRDDKATPADENTYLRSFLDRSMAEGNVILVTDYCSTHSNMDDSYSRNHAAGYVSFAADSRELDRIPVYPDPIYGENDSEIAGLQEVQNFLYLINPENFSSKSDLIQAVTSTNYDLLIMDLFFRDNTAFTESEISQLRSKANGGKRLVIAYMSIGEAEDYRFYWQSGWSKDPPSWMDGENPDWEGNFKVWYWEEEWQAIIYGSHDSYLGRILEAGFDGVYLDIIDAFEYYE
jgi:cysteinyl-tRNA synthetase